MFWMTQSLLSSWLYYRNAEEPFAESAYESFLASLRREKGKQTRAMLEGIEFEALVNDAVAGKFREPPNEKWKMAVHRFAKLCTGGQAQVPVCGHLTVSGMDFVLYGVCDYVKAGRIYDIKKVSRYEYGKYVNSPQHSMYFYMLPEAVRFDYLIFDGSTCYTETYRRCDCKPVEVTIAEFIRYLNDTGQMDSYKSNWSMNQKREDMVHDL